MDDFHDHSREPLEAGSDAAPNADVGRASAWQAIDDADTTPEISSGIERVGRSYFQAVFESDRLALWLLTPDGVIVDANQRALERVGATRDDVVWRPFWEALWWWDERARTTVRTALDRAQTGGIVRTSAPTKHTTGTRALELTIRPTHDNAGQITALIVEGLDPSERLAAQARFERLAEGLDEAVVVLDGNLVPRYANAMAGRLMQLRVAPSEDGDDAPDATRVTMSIPLPRYAPIVDEDNQPVPSQQHPAALAASTREAQPTTKLGMVFESATVWFDLQAEPLPGGDVLVRGRPTERRKPIPVGAASLDDLTKLPSRAAFFASLTNASGGEEPFGVLHVDVDDFRHLNDRLGHARADAFLHRFAQALHRCLRPGDFVARVGGDEFAVLLPGLGDEASAVKAAARILQQLREPMALDDDVVGVSASMGIAIGHPGDDPEVIARNADLALRHAKKTGRDRYAIYDETLSHERADEALLLGELKSALERDQLDVHYQPLVDAKDHTVIGCEALMRWNHPELGSISPGRFIPLAERSGLILSMEQWLLGVALAQLKQWNQIMPDFRMSVNLSARQLDQKGFFRTFESAVSSSGVNPRNLQVEVTETYAMTRPTENSSLLRAIADLGVTLAIDDFGTGYSNMGHLQHLPFAVIKIDRSFMEDVPTDPRNFALVRTVIAMAQSLELSVVAEGVETQAQADFLFWEGANTLQGFLFGKPVDAGFFERKHLS